MNLVIDVGNSAVKLALFQDDSLFQKQEVAKTKLVSTIQKIIKTYHPTKAILSSVGSISPKTLDKLNSFLPIVILSNTSKFPFTNLYKTPQTVGSDRLALAAAAVSQYPHKNSLVIDAGSCITYDFVDEHNNYHGGGISPGLSMRYHALNTFTAKLPLLKPTVPSELVGTSTETSIHSGTFGGVLREIDSVIFDYKRKYTDLTIILTGGDSKLLANQLKNSIFANSNFLLEGLNRLLEFNTK